MGVPGVECFDWTSDAVERLKALWADGLSASQISREIGASRNGVIGKVHRLGLSGRHQANVGQAKPRPVQRLTLRADAGMLRRIASKPRAENDPHKFEAEVAVELPPDQSPDAVAFLDRKRAQCCWPLGFPAADMLVCGSPRDGEHSYCPRHHRLSVQTSRRSLPELTDAVRAQRAIQARKNLAAHKERLMQA